MYMEQKYPKRYYIDINIRRIRRYLKKVLPKGFTSMIASEESFKDIYLSLNNQNVYPWTSPNVWMEIVDYYNRISNPVVFEYGTGASSITHVANLLKLNGTYIGVENDRDWFDLVFQSLVIKLSMNEEVQISRSLIDDEDSKEFDYKISTNNINIILKLRKNKKSYVDALTTACDVAIVDGKYRIQCVNKILSTNYLADKGMLALMEAGRGSPGWWEGDLTGENDYSPAINQMLNQGGKIIDGDGVDNWPQLNRKSPNPISYFYPKEACILIRSNHI